MHRKTTVKETDEIFHLVDSCNRCAHSFLVMNPSVKLPNVLACSLNAICSSFNLGNTYHTLLGCILQRLDHLQPLFKSHLLNIICFQIAKFLWEKKQTGSASYGEEWIMPVQSHAFYKPYCPFKDNLKTLQYFYHHWEGENKISLSIIPCPQK